MNLLCKIVALYLQEGSFSSSVLNVETQEFIATLPREMLTQWEIYDI